MKWILGFAEYSFLFSSGIEMERHQWFSMVVCGVLAAIFGGTHHFLIERMARND